jgi:hypothetical protein
MRPGLRATAKERCDRVEYTRKRMRSMDWQRIERKLARSFRARPQHIGESVVVHRRRPLPLAPVLEEAMTEDERDEYGELEHWPGSVSEPLDGVDAQIPLLRFYWESLGPMSWVAGMVIVGTGDDATSVCGTRPSRTACSLPSSRGTMPSRSPQRSPRTSS